MLLLFDMSPNAKRDFLYHQQYDLQVQFHPDTADMFTVQLPEVAQFLSVHHIIKFILYFVIQHAVDFNINCTPQKIMTFILFSLIY